MRSLKWFSGIRRGRRLSRAANCLTAFDCCGISRCADPDGPRTLQKCLRRAYCRAARGLPRLRELTDLEKWTETNYKMISALAQEVKVEPEVISDLLYGMTVQKFNDLLSSVSKCECKYQGCKIPMVSWTACDFYPAIFDKKRNLRSPMQPDAKAKLIDLLHELSKQQPLDDGREALYGDSKMGGSKRGKSFPWLEPGSSAYENGLRRRAMVDYHGRSLMDDLFSREFLANLPGKNHHHHRKSAATDGEGRSNRNNLNQSDRYKTPNNYAEAIKELQSIPMGVTAKDGSESHVWKHRHRLKRHSGHTPRHSTYYYGAQVPILAHEPFDARKPSTWIRRHPHPMRLADSDGTIVQDKPLRRYQRASVKDQLSEARKRMSVRSEYNPSNRNSASSELISRRALRRTPSAVSRKGHHHHHRHG